MEIGIRLHDTAGSNLEEHLRNAKEQGVFLCSYRDEQGRAGV